MPFMNTDTETARIDRLIVQGGRTGMTELQFFAAEIREWKDSPRRRDQIKGELYYEGKHDILTRQRTAIKRRERRRFNHGGQRGAKERGGLQKLRAFL